MADARRWPAIDLVTRRGEPSEMLEGMVAAVLADFQVLAIQDLAPTPAPPGGLWDPDDPVVLDPPPAPLHWRVGFAAADERDAAERALRSAIADLDITPLDLADDDWVARSQRALGAITAGPFIVAPPWDVPDITPAGTHLIVIEPSMGFGTGHHETTRLCLVALAQLDLAHRRVLDLGTGSGVLAFAAAAAGATDVEGVDFDPDAVEAAQRSRALNRFPVPVSLRVADVFADTIDGADVVVANLTGAMLRRLPDRLRHLTRTNGWLVISGFMADERPGVEDALTGFDVVRREAEGEWCVSTLRRCRG